MSHFCRTTAVELPLILLFAVCVGCQSNEDRATLNLQGNVTFDGEPVPVGVIQFIPQSGAGVQGFARIKNGRFNTSAAKGRGIEPGEHLVKVVGYDGIAYEDPEDNEVNGNGTLLFPQYQVKKTFAPGDRNYDISIPKQ